MFKGLKICLRLNMIVWDGLSAHVMHCVYVDIRVVINT